MLSTAGATGLTAGVGDWSSLDLVGGHSAGRCERDRHQCDPDLVLWPARSSPAGLNAREAEGTLRSGSAPASDCPSPCGSLARRAILRFTETPNQWLNSGRPVPARGAVARRHERGMGCGGRESVGAQVRVAGRVEPRERLTGVQDERRFSVRQNRVVLTPVAGAKSAVANSDPTGLSSRKICRRR